MYTSPDEDRSDLFLAAAAFVLGPQILGIVLGWLPLPGVASPAIGLLLVLATTVLVPLLLIRYRKQRWGEFGFDGPVSAAGWGAVASIPVVVAYVVSSLIRGGGPLPVGFIGDGSVGAVFDVVIRIVLGMATMVLVIYVVVKARTSFRTDPGYIRPTMLYLAKFTAISAAVATVLLLLTILTSGVEARAIVEVLLPPLGIAASGWLVYRKVRGSQLTSRMILLVPMILLAIGAFTLFGQAAAIVIGLWQATMLAGIGLLAAVLLESSRSAWAPLGFAAGLTLLTPLLVH